MTPTHAIYQQWQVKNNKQRLFSAVLAVLITSSLSLQYTHQSNKIVKNDVLDKSLILLILNTKLPAQPKEVIRVVTKKRLKTKLPFIFHDSKQANKQTSKQALTITPIQHDLGSKASPTIEQTGTLVPLSSKEMLNVYNESKSEIQKMTESSGKKLKSPIKTQYDHFQTAAENAAIPDCLAPQKPNGIGLFALPVIIFAAATGKCK